jgi:hypothetical protein
LGSTKEIHMPDRDFSSYWASLSRRRLNRRTVLAAGGAGALTAALAACGNKSKSASSSSSPSSAGTTTGNNDAPAKGSPVQGGTFTWPALSNSILDPQKSSAGAQTIVGGVYSRLFRFVTGPDPKTFTDHNVENRRTRLPGRSSCGRTPTSRTSRPSTAIPSPPRT